VFAANPVTKVSTGSWIGLPVNCQITQFNQDVSCLLRLSNLIESFSRSKSAAFCVNPSRAQSLPLFACLLGHDPAASEFVRRPRKHQGSFAPAYPFPQPARSHWRASNSRDRCLFALCAQFILGGFTNPSSAGTTGAFAITLPLSMPSFAPAGVAITGGSLSALSVRFTVFLLLAFAPAAMWCL
jgi:hypothetical protein